MKCSRPPSTAGGESASAGFGGGLGSSQQQESQAIPENSPAPHRVSPARLAAQLEVAREGRGEFGGIVVVVQHRPQRAVGGRLAEENGAAHRGANLSRERHERLLDQQRRRQNIEESGAQIGHIGAPVAALTIVPGQTHQRIVKAGAEAPLQVAFGIAEPGSRQGDGQAGMLAGRCGQQRREAPAGCRTRRREQVPPLAGSENVDPHGSRA